MEDLERQNSPHYSYIYQMGLLTGYGSYLSRRAIDKGFFEVFWALLIGFIYFVIYYCSKFYLSKKEFQVPKWIEWINIVTALLFPLSIFVSDKIVLVFFNVNTPTTNIRNI